MANPQPAILANLEEYQWYTHLSRTEGADLGVIKQALRDLRAGCDRRDSAGQRVHPLRPDAAGRPHRRRARRLPALPRLRVARRQGRQGHAGGAAALGPLRPTRTSAGRRSASSATRSTGHMTVARETPTFIYRNSLDLTGFIDGTGNPEPEDQHDRGIVPDGQPGAGGSFCIAQRWVHDLDYFNGLSLEDQENTFGRTKADSDAPRGAGARRRTSRTSSCARATRRDDDASRSAARWCAARRRTRSTTAPSACTSWASARRRRRCASAWRRSTA